MMANQIDADEEFARRLQAQELGLADAETPLMQVNTLNKSIPLKLSMF